MPGHVLYSDVTSWERNNGATWETGVFHTDSSGHMHMEPAAAVMPASTALPHQHHTTLFLQAEGTPLTCAAQKLPMKYILYILFSVKSSLKKHNQCFFYDQLFLLPCLSKIQGQHKSPQGASALRFTVARG